MEQFRRGELVFDVRDSGPADGPVVVMLHGFPQRNTVWNAVIPRLAAMGYRCCLAPNQRGYSPRARPGRRRDYRMPELVDDVGALIDASGADRVHLVGHDWGGFVAWSFAARYPHRLATLSSLSSPHPRALLQTMMTSRQGLVWQVYLFQLPLIPERLFAGSSRNADRVSKILQRGGQSTAAADRDARALSEPATFTAAVNWYRGAPFSGRVGKVTVPTMYVWSDGDRYLHSKAAHKSGDYVSGEYRFEILRDVSHWMPEEQPDTVADLLLDWFATHPT
ncbi:MAG: alpha/beta fold hydrolase [Mycobacterium sp.]